ncbi:MAG: hypothetical protein MUO40_12790 [Anaerolineaceae bacterium]|nr:hypothetical protein [Anaerolineaceae bacterium]
MKKINHSRVIGKIMYASGIFGIIIAITFSLFTWIAKVQINKFLQTTYTSFQSVIITSKDGLVLINESLQQVDSSLSTIQSIVDNLAISVNNLVPITNETAEIIGNDLNNIVKDAQTSLDSASSSSKIIDDTLKILAAIPLLGLDFQPDVPLHTSLTLLSSDLNNLPDNLSIIQSNLYQTGDSLGTLASSLFDLSTDLSEFEDDIEKSINVIANYELAADSLEQSLAKIQKYTNLWLTGISILITILMIWLLLAQISPLFQAYDILIGKNQYVSVHDILKDENINSPNL